MRIEHGKKVLGWIVGVGVGVIVAVGTVVLWMTFVLPSELRAARREYTGKFDGVTVQDGIDRDEATALAEMYLSEYVSGCGAPSVPKLTDGVWVTPLRVGFGGTFLGDVVRIDARSGALSSNAGPSFANYASFRRHILWGLRWRRL